MTKTDTISSIAILSLAFFASLSIANGECYSGMKVDVTAGCSLDGFSIYLNGYWAGYTDAHGEATIVLDESFIGNAVVAAAKDDNGVSYQGEKSFYIPCFDETAKQLAVHISAKAKSSPNAPPRESPNEQPTDPSIGSQKPGPKFQIKLK